MMMTKRRRQAKRGRQTKSVGVVKTHLSLRASVAGQQYVQVSGPQGQYLIVSSKQNKQAHFCEHFIGLNDGFKHYSGIGSLGGGNTMSLSEFTKFVKHTNCLVGRPSHQRLIRKVRVSE